MVANPCAGRRESNLKRGSYSSIFIDREAYLRPPVFTQVTAIPSDSDGSPIMSSLSLIVSDVGHQGSFEGRFDYLLRRNGRQNPGPGRPQSPPRLHLVFSERKFGIVRGVWRSHVLIVGMVFWTMVVGTRFKLGRRGARVGRERRGGLSRDLTTFLVCTPLLSRLPSPLI